MRNFIGGLLIGLVAGVVIAVLAPTADREMPKSGPLAALEDALPPAERIVWRMASAFAGDLSGMGSLARETAARLGVLTDGAIAISFHEPGALVPSLELFDAVASGAVEAAFASPAYWADKQPALQLFGAIPFGPDAREYLAWFEHGGGRRIYEAIYRRRNLEGLVCGIMAPAGGGWFQKPIRVAADFKGLRIAAVGLAAAVVKELGAMPVRLAPGDLAGAFEARRIDAAMLSSPAADLAAGLHKAAPYYYFPGWFQQTGIVDLLIHRPQWQRLSARQKAAIRAVCDANLARGIAAGEAGQFEALKSLVLRGIKVERWDRDMLAALEAAWKKVAAAEAKSDPDFAKAWNSLRRFREDYAIWRELGSL